MYTNFNTYKLHKRLYICSLDAIFLTAVYFNYIEYQPQFPTWINSASLFWILCCYDLIAMHQLLFLLFKLLAPGKILGQKLFINLSALFQFFIQKVYFKLPKKKKGIA